MKSIFILITSIILLVIFCITCNAANPDNLKCEYLVNPVGIDNPMPRFMWQINSHKYSQDAFNFFIGTDSLEVSKGKGNIWESGTINSNRSRVTYGGKQLQPFTRYYWGVKVQDKTGNEYGISPIAFFETGLMKMVNWRGNWITDTYDINIKPASYFRKSFSLKKKVKSARAYIAVAGLYELSINGEKVGNHRLDPMYTRYDRRTLYVTHDVTSHLTSAENVFGVLLGNGWYNHQSTAVWYFDKAPWRARPKFCMDIRITYEDGSIDIISTDSEWKTAFSPVIFNSIFTAEHYDARLEIPDWDKPGFNDSEWKKVLVTGAPSKNIVSQNMMPIRNLEELRPKSMKKLDEYTFLFDFGRNISGVTKIKVKGQAGTTVRLKHAEKLRADGHVDQSNIDIHYRPTDDSDPFQTDILILSGTKEDVFMPRFNYKGFQYLEVSSDKPIELSMENISAYFMHSDVQRVGNIHSSNETLNKTWQAANSSYLSNLHGYPTDCPQREKNGWTGDAHINIETALYNYDAITIYEKWMADHRDEQQPNGVLPAIIPTSGWGYDWANGPDWTSTIAIIPWNIYLFYGDKKILKDCYDNLKLYVEYINKNWPSGITDWGLGDWVPVKSKTPREFTSSTYYYTVTLILSKAAKLLGNENDYKKYLVLAEKIKQAINDKYLNRETGIYGSGFQTELSVALYSGLVPEELKNKVAENLAERVQENNYHIDVGLLGSKAILNALSENGFADIAYKVASQEDYPSWGWWIINGATTFYENWDIDASRDISMNHIMFGEINAWYYKGLGGIFPDEENPGFKNVLLKPNFVEGLNHFEAKYKSTQGEIVSSWKKNNNKIQYIVTIPPNSNATLTINLNMFNLHKRSIEKRNIRFEEDKNNLMNIYLKSGNYEFEMTKI